jgi:hypothetical protein
MSQLNVRALYKSLPSPLISLLVNPGVSPVTAHVLALIQIYPELVGELPCKL